MSPASSTWHPDMSHENEGEKEEGRRNTETAWACDQHWKWGDRLVGLSPQPAESDMTPDRHTRIEIYS